MNDLTIKQFENGLVEYINSTNLPLEVKRLVLVEVYGGLVNAANDSAAKQAQARQAEMAAQMQPEAQPEEEEGEVVAD